MIRFRISNLFCCLLVLFSTAIFGTNYLISGTYRDDFIAITTMALSFIVIISYRKINIRSEYSFTLLLNILMLVVGFLVAFKYNLTMKSIFKESIYTIAPIIIYYAFNTVLKKKNDIESLLKIIIIASIICNLSAFLEMFFSLRGIDLLNMDVFSKLRDGTPRFIIGEVILTLGLLISFSVLFDSKINRNNKRYCIINIILTIINLIFIIKTRTLILYLFLSLLMLPIINKNSNSKRKVVFIISLLIMVFFVSFTNYIPYVNQVLNDDAGVKIRYYEIEYYLDYFKNNWLTGVGYISSNLDSPTSDIVYGPYNMYYTSDVGIIGLLFRNGIIGLMWIISWFYSSIKIEKKYKAYTPTYFDNLVKLIIIFNLLSCINLIFTDTPRFTMIAISMLIIGSSKFFVNTVKENE